MRALLVRYSLCASVLLLALSLSTGAVAGSKRALPPRENSVFNIHADLDGAAALPSNSGPATGDLVGSYDPATHVLRFQARFFFLSGEATNARFHGPAAVDLVAGATVAAPRPSARLVTGSAWLNDEEQRDLLAGRWYFNVTTDKHPEGEIRGMVRIDRSDHPDHAALH